MYIEDNEDQENKKYFSVNDWDNQIENLVSGKGYWVRVTEDVIWRQRDDFSCDPEAVLDEISAVAEDF